MTKYYAACVGNDGFRPVVWGAGVGDDGDEAAHRAQEDAKNWLAEAEDPENAEIETVSITEEQYKQIVAGNVDPSNLQLQTR